MRSRVSLPERGAKSTPMAAPMAAPAVSAPAATVEEKSDLPEGQVIKSPMVGTFYRSASPGSDPFVEVGSVVKSGQTLCIVEAMKLMNEIESEVDGTVVAILLENGKSVEFGTPLFVVAP